MNRRRHPESGLPGQRPRPGIDGTHPDVDGTTVVVDRLVAGGDGMGRWADGRAVFCPRTVPGDVISVNEAREKKSYLRVESHELLKSGADRVLPACPVATTCGGCDWMHLAPEAQLHHKAEIFRQALVHTGKLAPLDLPEIELFPSPQMERYRSRIRLHVQGGRLGFYSEKSHQLIEVEDCLVASEQLCRLLKEVRAWLVRQLAHASEVRSLELRALQPESQALPHPRSCSVTIVLASGSVVTAGLRRAAAELDSHAIVHFSGEKATPQRLDESEPHTYAFPGAFSQVNRHVNQHLVARVVQAARSLGAATFLDVYCGNGNFSLPLLSQGLSGVGVDLSKDGIECAEYGARGMADRGRFFAEPAVHFLARSEIKERSFDLAIVDPPRRGAKEVLSHLVQLRLRALIMVSCDPVTCARDLGFLTERGFVLDALAVFDMFPQTHHLEAFVLLRRPS